MIDWARRAAQGAAAVLAVVLAAACAQDVTRLEPVIDAPAPGTDAYPFDGVEQYRLSIARAGDPIDLQSVTVGPGGTLALSEIPFGERMVLHLSGLLTSGVEVSYGRSCPVDILPESPADRLAPHIYFSRIVKWAAGAVPLVADRMGGAAYRSETGLAVFIGGDPQVEVFDPLRGQFVGLGVDALARMGGVLADFPDGRALVAGGRVSGALTDVVEVIDPSATGAGQVVAVTGGPRLEDTAAVALVDGSVLVAGGRDGLASDRAWRFAFGDGGSLEPPAERSEHLIVARYGHTATRLGDDLGAAAVLIGGRDDSGAPVAQAELYRPLSEVFELVQNGVLAVPRWGHRALRLPGGAILVVGGFNPDPVPELELYDPVQGRFTSARSLPAQAGLSEFSATPLPDGRVLLAGGLDVAGDRVATAFIARLDPRNGRVDIVRTDDLLAPRAGHLAVPLCDGTVLLVGGGNGDSAVAASERYNPPSSDRR